MKEQFNLDDLNRTSEILKQVDEVDKYYEYLSEHSFDEDEKKKYEEEMISNQMIKEKLLERKKYISKQIIRTLFDVIDFKN